MFKNEQFQTENSNQNQMTTLNVEHMSVTVDELTNAMLWLEGIAKGDTQGAAPALAICWFLERYERTVDGLSRNK
jgi:hypothetical protein